MKKEYDIIIIGGGSAGLTAAGFAVQLKSRVAIVEKDRMGGDCTWTGCVPSKSLLKAAKVAHQMRTADRYGLVAGAPVVDLKQVMAQVRSVVMEVYDEESPEALRADGIDVYLGPAQFQDAHTLSVGDLALTSRYFLIASGAHPSVPSVPGLADVDHLTCEGIWDMEVLPRHLLVLGAGPVGSEMAQAFRRLGARVTLVDSQDRILHRDEPDASRVVARVFEREGIGLRLNATAERVWQDADGIHLVAGGVELPGDALLVASGRRPNVQGLGLDRAGVAASAGSIKVDDNLRTTRRHIYAAGDVIGGYQFTHYAGRQALMAARSALLPGASAGVKELVPWTTFTDPEVARTGLTEEQARSRYGTTSPSASGRWRGWIARVPSRTGTDF